MTKVRDNIRDADPELWKQIKIISIERNCLIPEWIVDWLRLAVRAEKTLGPKAMEILKNKLDAG